MAVGQIEGQIFGRCPAGANGDGTPRTDRDAHGAVFVAGRRWIIAEAAADFPLRIESVCGADGKRPSVFPVQLLLYGAERAVSGNVKPLQATPTRPGRAG